MENFLFACNATVPVFLIILLGWVLSRLGLLNDNFCKVANNYVFKCALPISLFQSISTMDMYTDFNLAFCIFCLLGATAMFMGVWGVSWLLLKDKGMVGAFSQASARSSAAILGIAFAMNIYGNTGLVPMMIVAAVPFFNLYSVVILTFSPHIDENGHLVPREGGTALLKKACLNIVTNPIIIGIILGVPFALLRITLPTMLTSALDTVGSTASPIALIVIGGSFTATEALKKWRPAAVATFIKLFLLPMIFLPIAIAIGFRNSELVAILIMVGSPTTATCYVMAKSMHGDGVLTSNIIILATLLSSVSLTLWLFILRSMAFI